MRVSCRICRFVPGRGTALTIFSPTGRGEQCKLFAFLTHPKLTLGNLGNCFSHLEKRSPKHPLCCASPSHEAVWPKAARGSKPTLLGLDLPFPDPPGNSCPSQRTALPLVSHHGRLGARLHPRHQRCHAPPHILPFQSNALATSR